MLIERYERDSNFSGELEGERSAGRHSVYEVIILTDYSLVVIIQNVAPDLIITIAAFCVYGFLYLSV
jgi:hypothetical protein